MSQIYALFGVPFTGLKIWWRAKNDKHEVWASLPPLASGCESLTGSHGHSANLCRRLHFNTSQTNSNPSGGRHSSSFALGKMFFGSYIIMTQNCFSITPGNDNLANFWVIATFFKLSCCVCGRSISINIFPKP